MVSGNQFPESFGILSLHLYLIYGVWTEILLFRGIQEGYLPFFHYLFLIRPRRFSKSLFLAMMETYCSMDHAGCFDELFAGLLVCRPLLLQPLHGKSVGRVPPFPRK